MVHKRERLVEGIGVLALMLVGAYMRLLHLPSIDVDGIILGEASGGLFLAFADTLASNEFIVPPVVVARTIRTGGFRSRTHHWPSTSKRSWCMFLGCLP